jgi:hypothetical protein
VVVKLAGILDTSDLMPTGAAITTGSLTTVVGSNTVTYTAAGAGPVVGQYVTFSNGTTTFPAGTYIKSIISATSCVLSNAALTLVTTVIMTAVAGAAVALDPAELSTLNGQSTGPLATRLIIDKISYNVEALSGINLYWEATTNDLITSLVSSGDDIDMKKYGGIYNTEKAGATGKIVYTTQGWVASAVLSYDIIIECRKK